MAVSRVIEVSFGRSSVALVRIDTAYFYNNGIIFKPTDIDLPASYQVHWADSPQASSTLETIGTAEGAPIPDDLWGRSRVIYGWIYLHPTNDSGITAYEVRIYKNVRAGLPDGTEPTPAEQSTIDQLIGALNSAVEQAEDAQEAIENMSVSATTLAGGESATVTKSEQDGVVHLAFGIPKGATGDDGYSPTANVSKSGKVATITITDKNGTTSAQVSDGTDGEDGVSPAVSVTDITGGHRVVITDKDGDKSFDVADGATGATPNLTIGTVETLDPTDDATATITGTPENPVLNLGIPQGDAGEVTLDEFYKAFPTDTASGSIASFSDGADDLPLKSLVVNIDPVQDLHGQDAPYPAGGGKNLFDANTAVQGYYISNDDGELKAGDASYASDYIEVDAGQTYRISPTLSSGNWGAWYDENKAFISGITGYATAKTAPSNAKYLRFTVSRNGSNPNYATTTQVEKGSEATAWSPYENICPISGWDAVNVVDTGKNLCDANNLASTPTPVGDRHGVTISKAGTYTIHSDAVGTGNAYIYVYPVNADGTYGALRYIVAGTVRTATTITITDGVKLIVVDAVGTNSMAISKALFESWQIQIELGSTATPYEPYTGRSITINLGQTVYGGKLDVLSGVLTVDRAMVDLGTLKWEYIQNESYAGSPYFASGTVPHKKIGSAVMVCSQYRTARNRASMQNSTIAPYNNTNSSTVACRDDRYTDADTFKSAMSGVTLCYDVKNTTTIQLTPNQVNSLLGVNNIWADSGDTTAEYRADTKLFIERLTAPDSADMIADVNITSGQYFMVGNSLYKATANIANGSAIIVGTNCIRKSLSEALNEINA